MPRIKLFNQEEVLTKAMELFWQKGYHATSIQDLVSFLGINRASLYDTFGGKQQLFNAALENYQRINHKSLKEFLNGHLDVREGLRTLFAKTFQQSKKNDCTIGCFMVNTTIEMLPNDKVMLEPLRSNRRKVEKILADYLRAGITRGQLRKDLNITSLASLLFTHYNGLSVVAKLKPNAKKMNDTLQPILSLLD